MKLDPRQLDLFVWGASRPTAEVIDFIPHVVRQIIRQRRQPRIDRGGKLVEFLPRPTGHDIRRTA